MYIIFNLLLFGVCGIHGTNQRNTPRNRIYKVPADLVGSSKLQYPNKVSSSADLFSPNDYGDRSGWNYHILAPRLYTSATPAQENTQAAVKIHQPKEDPKLYYQSEAYLKEINTNNINNEVSHVYPGREVIRADEDKQISTSYGENKNIMMRRYLRHGSELCIKCPSDRTLITRSGADEVKLVQPRLVTCMGHRPPRSVRFVHMYGPKFGSFLKQGSYTIVGKIIRRGKVLQHCALTVYVIIQRCHTPNYLISNCDSTERSCEFLCRDPNTELYGDNSLDCTDELIWNGSLPHCLVRKKCNQLPPPKIGHITCKGNSAATNSLIEGSVCRIWCPPGWRRNPRSITFCHHGVWTNKLQCKPT